MTVQKSSKIYIAGHRGMVDSAIVRRLQSAGYTNLITRTRQELNLLDQRATFDFLQTEKSDYIFMAAARVGGIHANNTYRADFIYENLTVQNNILHGALKAGIKDLCFLGSSCIYPRDCPQPIKEDYLLTGPLEQTNEPYAIAKIAGIKLCESCNRQYGYGLYACNGILFNHESPVRGETFVTRKITRALARIKLGLQDTLYLGNMDAKRDWGHAKDYVEMQWLMLQQEKPEDFVIATGVQYSVRDFVNAAAKELGMDIRWEGQGVDEKGYLISSPFKGEAGRGMGQEGSCVVAVEPRYFRPTEVETLLGDPTKAKEKLGWTPSTTFDELVAEMVREDLKSAERDELVKHHGYKAMDYHE